MLKASLFQQTVRDGARCSTAKAFLHPAMGRKNLTIITHCHVVRVLIEEKEKEEEGKRKKPSAGARHDSGGGGQKKKVAVGVECIIGKNATLDISKAKLFRATKEVVLSAGQCIVFGADVALSCGSNRYDWICSKYDGRSIHALLSQHASNYQHTSWV
jgi:hypothetical protein